MSDSKNIPGLNNFLSEINNPEAGDQHPDKRGITIQKLTMIETGISDFHRRKAPNAIKNTQAKLVLSKKKNELAELKSYCVGQSISSTSNIHHFVSALFE